MANPTNYQFDIEAFKAKLAADIKAAQGRAEAAKHRVHARAASFRSRADEAIALRRANVEAAKAKAKVSSSKQRKSRGA